MGMEGNVPREIQETVKDVVGRKQHICLMAMVQLEVKADRPENRVLALTDYRFYVLFPKVPSKVEHNVPFLDLQAVESRNTLQLVLTTESKRLVFSTVLGDSVLFNHVITHIGASLTTIFPLVPLDKIVHKISVSPSERLGKMHEKIKKIQKKEQGPCGGFSVAYKAMSDYHWLPFMEDVAWDVDTIYLSHDTRELNLGDFDHLDPRHLIPIVAALGHNTWFTKLNASNIKISLEVANEILKVMKRNTTIDDLQLSNTGIKWDFANKLAHALMANANSPLAKLDLSSNFIEDRGITLKMLDRQGKGINNLCGSVAQMSHGLVTLNLARTGVTARGVNRLTEALAANKFIANTLRHLDLSDNVLRGDDIGNLYQFLANPNALTTLKLCGNECALETIFGALLRGCLQSLSHLDLSRNAYSTKRQKDVQVPNSWQAFFASSMALKYVNLSECKLPPEAVKSVLLGISANLNISDLEVNLSSVNLGLAGCDFLKACFSRLPNVAALDISDNGLDAIIPMMVEQLSKNKGLRKLALGRNFSSVKPRYLPTILGSIVKMIQEDDSSLESLSLADSKLKLETVQIINALGGNTSLTEIDVSGNQMGDTGARMLAKALQINNKLRSVLWDKNCTSAQGFTVIAAAMVKNYALKTMPTPVHDASAALRLEPEKTSAALERIEALLQRNHSPRKFASDQGYRLQQGFLISSTQQMVDKHVVQIQEVARELERGKPSQTVKDDIERANLVVKEADLSTQMLPKLQEIALKSEEPGNAIETKIRLLSTDLQIMLDAQLRNNMKDMLKCVAEQCPTVLGEKDLKEEMKVSCTEKGSLPQSFCEALLQDQVGTDVFNKISELNLLVASHMTDKLIDGTLDSLERVYRALQKHLKEQGHSRGDEDLRRDARPSLSKKDSLPPPPESPSPLPKISHKRESQFCRRLRPQSVIDPADVEKARKLAQTAAEEKVVETRTEDSESLSRPTSVRVSKRSAESKKTSSSPKSPAPPPPSGSRKAKGQAPPVPRALPSAQPVAAPRKRDTGGEYTPIPAPRSTRRKRHSVESQDTPEFEMAEGKAAEKRGTGEALEAVVKAEPEMLVQKAKEEVEDEEEEEEEEEEDDEEEEEEDSKSRDSKDGIEREKEKDADTRSLDTIDSISTAESSLDSRESTPTSDGPPSKFKDKGAKAKKSVAELPSLPLDTEAPKLEHLAKARPRRAKTRPVGRPVVKADDMLIEDAEQVDQGVDSFFESKPVSKEAVAVMSGEKEMNKQNSVDEKGKEEATSKKKGWSPFSTGDAKALTAGISHFFSTKKSSKSPDAPKKGGSGRTTPPTHRSPDSDLEKEDTGGFKSEEDKEEADEEIKPTPRKPRGVGLPGMGISGGSGGALLAEMKAKRESKALAPSPPKKVDGDKDHPSKESLASPGSKQALKPPSPGAAKLPSAVGASQRTPVIMPHDSSKPVSTQHASVPGLAEDGSSTGAPAKAKASSLRKPPPVAPKPSKVSVVLPSATGGARQNTAPPRPAALPQRRLSDLPDDKDKSKPAPESSVDSRMDSPVSRKSSVKQKAALLDKNSNETPPSGESWQQGSKSKSSGRDKTPEKDLQRTSSSGSRDSKVEGKEKQASDAGKATSEDDIDADVDKQLNGSTPNADGNRTIYL